MAINSYGKTNVTPKWPLELFDPSPYLKKETDSLPDERRGQAVVLNRILLELRAMQEVLGTIPNWKEGDTFLDVTLGNMMYGDGSDGNVDVGSPITLNRDMYYENLNIGDSGEIDTAGYRIFVRSQLNIASGGVIHHRGNDASGTNAGVGLFAQVLGESSAGGNAGSVGTTQVDSLGGDGGSSGNAGGLATVPDPNPGVRDIATATTLNWHGVLLNGGAGGGGGSGTLAGGGGGGGGVILIAARNIINHGTIDASGGDGADSDPGESSDGGGGGGGGLIMVLSTSFQGNQPDASGGAGGTGHNGGSNGDPGSDGSVYVITL
jgi:hypothetical protein